MNVNKRKGIDTTFQNPTDPRKKKFNNMVASPFKKGNDEVASPLVDERPQKLNEEVETANDTIEGSAVNSTAVTDDNVTHLTNENPFFGNDVEEEMDDNGVSAVEKHRAPCSLKGHFSFTEKKERNNRKCHVPLAASV